MGMIKNILLIIIFSILLIMATGSSIDNMKPTQVITRTCSRTLYPELCVNSLLDFPGSDQHDLIHITINMTLHQFRQALYHVTTLTSANNLKILNRMPKLRAAYDDCFELLDDAVYYLDKSLESMWTASTQDVMTWLSSAMTSHDTCVEGLYEVGGRSSGELKDLSKMVSICLAMFESTATDDKDCVPVEANNRRRMMLGYNDHDHEDMNSKFPMWVSKKERYLLDAPVTDIHADIVVSKDGTGTGTVKTIAEAIRKAPEFGTRRTIIYVKAGRYEEDILKVGRKKTNLMFIGDGKGKTVITGGKSVFDHLRTFGTATFAASGEGFIARDMTFENWAGPEKEQAVALLISADKAVIYRCDIKGYQDTLYVHCSRQFFRECNVYGTIDFIFGNSAVVFQNCNLYARKPLPYQKITITAQNRIDPRHKTGISIHNCKILPDNDLLMLPKGSFATYLGRPWKAYSRTVYMMSYMGDHVHPKGWLDWNDTFKPIETLYYGEYANAGPGAALNGRVNWPGYHVITNTAEASKFTVGKFICGSSWLPATGVAFVAGLSV